LNNQGLDLDKIREIVGKDSKQRYDLIFETNTTHFAASNAGASTEPSPGDASVWWIRARQGHSLKVRSTLLLKASTQLMKGKK
jgi:2'-phosphotransferase